jgi:hypothetical protein
MLCLLVPRLQSQLNRVPTALDLTSQPLDLAERNLQAIPLRLELLAAGGIGQGVVEGRGVGPQCELAFGGVAGEQVQDGGDEELLRLGQLTAGGGGGERGGWGEDGVLGEGGWGCHFG